MTKTVQSRPNRADRPQPPVAEAALRKSEERLRRITDNMVDLVVQVDMAVVEFVSPSVKKILSYDIKELIGRKRRRVRQRRRSGSPCPARSRKP